MPQMIEIEGDLARIITREVVNEIALADLIPHIETRLPTVSPVLPDRTRLYSLDPSDNATWQLGVMVELEPRVRTLTMHRGESPRLAIPYTEFVFHLSSTDQGRSWMFMDYNCLFSKQPVLTGDELLIPALLPNVFENGAICFGNTAPTMRNNTSLAERINAIVNEFYLTEFSDQGHTRMQYLPYGAARRNYAPWIAATVENPRCWENWEEFNRTFANQQHFTAKEALLRAGGDRMVPIVMANGIPDIPHTMTFGRAEEWLRGISPANLHRLGVAFDRIRGQAVPPADDDTDD